MKTRFMHVGLALCACAALPGGALWRTLRRLLRLPPRIWHGMYPLHSVRDMVLADLRAGYASRSVVRTTRLARYALVEEKEFDRVADREGVDWPDWNWVCLTDLLLRGDIWVAFFECLFFRPDQMRMNRLTMRLIRMSGIRIIVAPHGGDILHQGRERTRFDWTGCAQKDYPDWDLRGIGRRNAEARIDLFCRYSDLVLGADSTLARFLPRKDLLFKYFPVDCDRLIPSGASSSDRVRIVHAPNHRFVKGTGHLVAALASLERKGIASELTLIEGVSRPQALRMYSEADIVADQFIIGAFGSFALEGMALGKPVLTYLDEEHLGDPVYNHPLVNTNPENLERVLAVLLLLPELRERLGRASRGSVERYQSIAALAQVWDRIYRHVWRGEELRLGETLHFSSERSPRSFTEDPALPEFWPTPVEDLLPEIHAALARAGFGPPRSGAAQA